jgi:hypothetical protein
MYHGVLNDPKVHRLTVVRRWRWVEILCIASAAKQRGRLPSLDDLAFHMRIKRQEVESVINDLIRVGLVDQTADGKGLAVHDWEEHQRPSDDVGRRVREFRERQRNVAGNKDVTLQGTFPKRDSNVLDSDTESDKDVVRLPSGGNTSHASAREAGPTRPATFKAPAVIDAETEARLTAEAAAKKARWDAAEAARRAKREANGQP